MALSDVLLGSERAVFLADGVVLPKVNDVKDFNDCCWCYSVLADTNSSDDYKNDYNGFFFQRQMSSDTCDFVLVESDGTENIITDDTYGTFKDFGAIDNNSELKTFILEWKKVIDSLGIGCYTIRLDKSIAGVSISETSLTYELMQFSTELANGTYRIDTIQDGNLNLYSTNFKGSEFKDSLRLRGYFGNATPEMIEDSIVFSNNERVQISLDIKNEYIANNSFIPIEAFTQLKNIILTGNQIFGNDYNTDNPSYDLVKIPLYAEELTPDYRRGNRNILVNMKFSDKFINNRKTNC